MSDEKTPKPLPPGILNFWANLPTEIVPEKEKPTFETIEFKGQIFRLIIKAISVDEAKKALGALIKIIVTDPEKITAFDRQALFFKPQIGQITEITLPPLTIYAKTGSFDKARANRMFVDRLAWALTECRRDPTVDKMIETLQLRIVQLKSK